MKNVKKVRMALCYDFDCTLSPTYMQNAVFLPELGINPDDFWRGKNELAAKQDIEDTIAYLDMMIDEAAARGVRLTREYLVAMGSKIPLFAGLETWFERINAYAATLGIEAEHFVISSGNEETISGTGIAKYFKNIFACKFRYDSDGYAFRPAAAVSYSSKTQYLARINKGVLNYYENGRVNQRVPTDELYVPYSNMIYIGDGFTDIPCMKMTMTYGGHAIAVYDPSNPKMEQISTQLLADGRVNTIAPADYSAGTRLEAIVKAITNKIKAQEDFLALAKV